MYICTSIRKYNSEFPIDKRNTVAVNSEFFHPEFRNSCSELMKTLDALHSELYKEKLNKLET